MFRATLKQLHHFVSNMAEVYATHDDYCKDIVASGGEELLDEKLWRLIKFADIVPLVQVCESMRFDQIVSLTDEISEQIAKGYTIASYTDGDQLTIIAYRKNEIDIVQDAIKPLKVKDGRII